MRFNPRMPPCVNSLDSGLNPFLASLKDLVLGVKFSPLQNRFNGLTSLEVSNERC